MSTPDEALFGRKYKLEILSDGSRGATELLTITDSSFEPEALRVAFDIQTMLMHASFWFASITIFNVNPSTVLHNAAGDLKPDMLIRLSAGFANGNSTSSGSTRFFRVYGLVKTT